MPPLVCACAQSIASWKLVGLGLDQHQRLPLSARRSNLVGWALAPAPNTAAAMAATPGSNQALAAATRAAMASSYEAELRRAHARVAMKNSYQALLKAAQGKAEDTGKKSEGQGARARSRTTRRRVGSFEDTDSNEPGGNPTVD
eukprot:13159108-Heterocapsa_arctica.AAC.1